MMKKIFLIFTILSICFSGWANEVPDAEITQQTRKLTGQIKDEQGEPMIGVSVVLVGSTTGTVTDTDGNFSLSVPSGNQKIAVSYIGYEKQEIVITGNQNNLAITLKENAELLDEVVVIGYGTARKKDLTGAISTIKASKLETEAPRSVQDLLRANAAGLNISMGVNAKGDADLQVRGRNTLKANSSPLIVVDGVIYGGALSDINPMDIQSVDVLKDASSAAVYGAKAASGVVAIVTKKGANTGKPLITFNTNIGVVTSSHQPEVLDAEGFLDYRYDYEIGKKTDAYLAQYPQMFVDPRKLNGINQLDWYNYDQKTPVTSVTEEQLIRSWLGRLELKTPEVQNYIDGRITNWQDLVFQNGLQQDYTVSISNKKEDLTYYWSLGYVDREGIIKNEEYKTFRSRLNLESNVTKFLTVGMNSNFASRDESYLATQKSDGTPSNNLTADWEQMVRLSPYAANEIGVKDSPYQRLPTGDPTPVNPFYDAMYRDRKNMYTTIDANLYAIVKLPLGFEYQFNYFPHLEFHEMYNHESSKNENWEAKGGEALRETQKKYNWQIDNLIRWKYTFNNVHKTELTLLQNAEQNQDWKQRMTSKGFIPSDVLGYHRMQSGLATANVVYSDDNYSTGDALMARLFYSFQDKYMVTGSLRRDGYSAFGRQNPHATFPAIALGWVFTSEKFAEKMSSWWNYGKLRFSYGENGNRDIGRYDALSDIVSSPHPYINQSGVVYTTSQLYVKRMENPNLKWESTAAYNLGLDFSFFNDLISGSFEGYISETNDLLVDQMLPWVSGYENIVSNIGKVENKGFEVTLNARPVNHEKFQWNISGNFSLNRRQIKTLYGNMVDIEDANGNVIGQKEADDIKNRWFIGQDPDRIWDWERIGVWQLGEEVLAAKYGCQPGDFKYKDQQAEGEVGYGVMTDDDKVFMGYKTPRFRWSLRNELNFLKNFSFSFLVYSYWGQYDTFNRASNNANFPDRCTEYVQPRWTRDNPINDYARIGSKNIGNNYLEKSFIRLDNISFSYNVPKNLLNKISVQNMRLGLSIRNVAWWAPHWDFWDPENSRPNADSDPTTLPAPRTYNLSVNFTL